MDMNYSNVQYVASYGLASQLPESDAQEIVFSGRSNVGKSSLINRLFGRKNLARVSSKPGKTVTINFYRSNHICFVDLPGYGYAKKSASEIKRWCEMIDRYFTSGRNIALVIQIIDSRHKPSDQDYQMLDFLEQMKIPYVIVLTKTDKLKASMRAKREREIPAELADFDAERIMFSSGTGEGLTELKSEIEYMVIQ